jgi:vacuole morphology and inheritance protein 14
MLLIRERIYTNNSSNRRFIISWLHTVLKMPGFTITEFVPEVVDGLFKVLDDPSPAVHDASITVLSELLHSLDPNEGGDGVSPTSIINILVSHTNGQSAPAREIALIWLSQFCVYYKKKILDSLAGILSAALPWLYDDKLKGIFV